MSRLEIGKTIMKNLIFLRKGELRSNIIEQLQSAEMVLLRWYLICGTIVKMVSSFDIDNADSIITKLTPHKSSNSEGILNSQLPK